MIHFFTENYLTKAVASPDEHAFIDSVLRYKVPSYEIIKRKLGYAAMRWDGTKSLYSKGIFLTGLLGKVTEKCREAGIVFEVVGRIKPVEARGNAKAVMQSRFSSSLRLTSPSYIHVRYLQHECVLARGACF